MLVTALVGLSLIVLNLYLGWRWKLGQPQNVLLRERLSSVNIVLGVFLMSVGALGYWFPMVPMYLFGLGFLSLFVGFGQYEDT